MSRKILFIFALIMPVMLTACGSDNQIRQSLGIQNEAPDEFQVMTHPPLSIPPDYALRPPQANNKAASRTRNANQARNTLITTTKRTAAPTPKVHSRPLTRGEYALLRRTGADKADPTIRSQLDQVVVTKQKEKEKQNIFERFFAKLRNDDAQEEDTLDAYKERERIMQQKTKNGHSG